MDRLADSLAAEGTHHAARLIAQEWDQYLDLIGRDGGRARAGLFLGVRVADGKDGAGAGGAAPDLAPVIALARADRWLRSGAAQAGDVDVRDLDVDARSTWTGEQWARAEDIAWRCATESADRDSFFGFVPNADAVDENVT